MKYFIVTVLAFFLATPAFAQLEKSDLRIVKQSEFEARHYRGDVEGSPFYEDEWQPGLVLLESGKTSNMVMLKYNIFQNRLLLQRNGNSYAVTPNRMTGFVFIDGARRTKFKKGFRSAKYHVNRNQLLQMIYDGNIKLVSRYKISKNQRRDAFSGAVTLRFITDHTYYLIAKNGAFHEVDLEKDDILEALGSHQDELKEFVQKNDLDWEEEAGLQQILTYYDSLVEPSN